MKTLDSHTIFGSVADFLTWFHGMLHVFLILLCKLIFQKMRPTIAIGDVHGLTNWLPIVNAHKNCRIIFLGDYLDPYQPMNKQHLLANLMNIIELKQNNPDDVVLLLGNHDLHYFAQEMVVSSRFDNEIADDASEIFRKYYDLFQFAMQDENCVFTHAGISQEWFEHDFKGDATKNIAQQLNNPLSEQIPALFQCGAARGGAAKNGGIFWADVCELYKPLRGCTQVVGHNRVDSVKEHTNNGGRIIFCDCLFNNDYLKI
jgi:hypothetical protein